jgi:bifunctional non-homologous end joining protein LigD
MPEPPSLGHARRSYTTPGDTILHAFDLLQLNAADLKAKPLAERRRRLVDLVHRLDEAVPVLYLPDAFTSGDELLAMCAKMRLEGIVSKRLGRTSQGPTRDWVKVKCAAWKEENRWRAEAFNARWRGQSD